MRVHDMAFLRRGPGDLLVCRPNPSQFGHLGIEIALGLAVAREERTEVAFLRDRAVVNPGAFELEADEVPVRMLTEGDERAIRSRWDADDTREKSATRRREFREDFWDEVGRLAREELKRRPDHPMRGPLRAWKARAGVRPPSAGKPAAPYLRRRLLRAPVRVRLRREAEAHAAALAQALGIPPEAPMVAVHVREAGWKRGGREVQHKVSRVPGERPRDDSTRNARIESHFEAIDDLVGQGFTVVRLGDRSMTPVARPGVVDLALDPRREPVLDIYCLLRSRFLLAGESGASAFTLLTDTPTLLVNGTDPITSFPIRPNWLFMLKHVMDVETGEELTLQQLLDPRYIALLRDTTRLRYVSNTPQEIRDGVREMLAFLEHPGSETANQARYREMATIAAIQHAPTIAYLRKWGIDGDFLGDGRIAPSYVDQHLS